MCIALRVMVLPSKQLTLAAVHIHSPLALFSTIYLEKIAEKDFK